MGGPNQGTEKGEEHIPATQAVVLNDRNMKSRGLPCGLDWSEASSHSRGDPAYSRVLQVGRARLWVETVLHRRGPLGGGGVVGKW